MRKTQMGLLIVGALSLCLGLATLLDVVLSRWREPLSSKVTKQLMIEPLVIIHDPILNPDPDDYRKMEQDIVDLKRIHEEHKLLFNQYEESLKGHTSRWNELQAQPPRKIEPETPGEEVDAYINKLKEHIKELRRTRDEEP